MLLEVGADSVNTTSLVIFLGIVKLLIMGTPLLTTSEAVILADV